MMPASLHLKIVSDSATLCEVRRQVEAYGQSIGYDESCVAGIMLAMDEALTNIIRHAYQGQSDQPIEISLSAQDGLLRIVIRDYGRVVPHEKIRSRDLTDIRPGGLGVHIMKTCMDTVTYATPEGGGTCLTMTKTLPPAKAES